MTMPRLLPLILSSLLIAAHFLRVGALGLAVLCLIVPLLLTIRHAWPVWVVRGFLLLASLEWLRTLSDSVAQRQSQGKPWLRLALIVGGIAAFTVASAWFVRGRTATAASSTNPHLSQEPP
ncbi:MAG: hypothetical protein QF689_15125 [Candidatus Latescibacteria bacterium]|nr:hypothetical protein [Candidatus Latescibacterota bacterium]